MSSKLKKLIALIVLAPALLVFSISFASAARAAGTPYEAPFAGTSCKVGVAGDIAGTRGDLDRAKQVKAMMDLAGVGHYVLPGDLAYGKHTPGEADRWFIPVYGKGNAAKVRPSPGNHEWGTSNASGYYTHTFPGIPKHYAYDACGWRMISIDGEKPGDVTAGAAFIRAEDAKNPSQPTMIQWHKPRWSSNTHHRSDVSVDALWKAAADTGAAIVVNGHVHAYERFTGLDAVGRPAATGPQQFVIGTGGRSVYADWGSKVNGSVKQLTANGAGIFTLNASGTWSMEFRDTGGKVLDTAGNTTPSQLPKPSPSASPSAEPSTSPSPEPSSEGSLPPELPEPSSTPSPEPEQVPAPEAPSVGSDPELEALIAAIREWWANRNKSPVEAPKPSPEPSAEPSPSPSPSDASTQPVEPPVDADPACLTKPGPLEVEPTPGNTGFPDGTVFTDENTIQGDYTAKAGEAIVAKKITGVLYIDGPDVTVACSHIGDMIENKSGNAIVWLTTIGEWGEDGGPAGIRNEGVEAYRVEITGTTDGIRAIGGDIKLVDSTVYGLTDQGETHNDGIQISAGANVTVENSHLEANMLTLGGADSPDNQTAVIGMYAAEGATLTIKDTTLSGQTKHLINTSGAGAEVKDLGGNVVDKPEPDLTAAEVAPAPTLVTPK